MTFTTDARVSLFGYPTLTATVVLRQRTRSWRLTGAAGLQGGGLLVAPLVGLFPPHAPWALGAVGIGFLLARRRLRHHFTLQEVTGRCPRCDAPLKVRPGMLRSPHPLACGGCGHDLILTVEDAGASATPP